MNGYALIMKLQQKMVQDKKFADRFNKAVKELNNIPGLQAQVLKIVQMNDESSRQNAINSLPKKAKNTVEEILKLLNN